MILTDGTTTLTANYEDVSASPVVNGNIETTIGGMVKSQADSSYLKIVSVIRISESDYLTYLKPIIENFSAAKYYTPPEALPGKSDAEEMEVVIEGAPEKIDEGLDGSTVMYFIRITMHEVIPGVA